MKLAIKIFLFIILVGVYINFIEFIVSEGSSEIPIAIGFIIIAYLFFKKKKLKPPTAPTKNETPQSYVHNSIFTLYRELDILVVGSDYENDDGIIRYTHLKTVKPFQQISLIREPDNKYDFLAIAVYITSINKKIGYIPKKYSKWLAQEIDKGRNVDAYYKRTLTEGYHPTPVIIVELDMSQGFS